MSNIIHHNFRRASTFETVLDHFDEPDGTDPEIDHFTADMTYTGRTVSWKAISKIENGHIWTGGAAVLFDNLAAAEALGWAEEVEA